MSDDGGLIAAWTRLFGACCLMDVWQQPTNWPSDSWRVLCAAATLWAVMKPSPYTCILTMLIRNSARVVKMPHIFDSDYWALLLDLAFVLGVLKAARRQDTSDSGVLSAAPVIRASLSMFYFAAGFWKINSSFLNPHTSCGSIFTVSLLVQVWPAFWGPIPDLVARYAVLLGPWMTVFGECTAGLTLAIPGKASKMAGLFLMLLLHLGISFTPFPNGIANFSYTAATRYFFLVPEGTSRTFHELCSLPRSTRGYIGRGAATIAVAAAWQFGHVAGPQHMGAVFFTFMMVAYLRAIQIELSAVSARQPCALGRTGWVFLAVASFVVFGAQVLGLMDLSALASPFSSIRVHGGSNHFLMPTGLLQAWASDKLGPGSSLGGGIVRVEYTDSVWLNSLYPAESTSEIPPRILETLRRGGHLARQFNPTPRRVLGPEIRSFMPRWEPTDGPFVQYTVPALELRRLVSEVRATGENFSIVYVRLPGVYGDEAWRSSAAGPRVEFSVTRDGKEHCTSDGAPCAPDELALLPEFDLLSWKTRVFFPYPVVADAHNELPCMD